MDPRSLLVIAALFMLFNGGVLGLMHKSLSPDVRPGAVSWRIGTLVMAGGCILFAVQDMLPLAFVQPVANGLMLVGAALYWRAMRRFCELPAHRLTWLPAILGIAGIYVFSAIVPIHAGRVVVGCAALAFYIFAAAWTLHSRTRADAETSRDTLIAIFVITGAFLCFRGLYFALQPQETANLITPSAGITIVSTLLVTALPVIGTTAFLVMCVERLRRQWERAAALDYLTGLPNRRTITGTGEARFNAARRASSGFAVAVVDIDHFKAINDRHGHDVGDLALKHVANVLDQACRGPNMVGRQGGEEFVVLLEDAGRDAALGAAERLRVAVETAPLARSEGPLHITISVGVEVIAENDMSFDDLLRRADQALYVAKAGGRNRVEMGAAP